jgi:hypothetical protein
MPAPPNKGTGNFISGGNTGVCSSAASQPMVEANCNALNSSNHVVRVATAGAIATSFSGWVATDSVNAAGTTTGPYIDLADWLRFGREHRLWIKNSSGPLDPASRGACLAGTCRMAEWDLSASANELLNRSNTANSPNSAFVAQAACPPELSGNTTLQDDTGQLYLKNAVEFLGDGTGDDDGLCENGDRCLYTPNFGAYQGHGQKIHCVFQDGVISSVKLQAHLWNGY